MPVSSQSQLEHKQIPHDPIYKHDTVIQMIVGLGLAYIHHEWYCLHLYGCGLNVVGRQNIIHQVRSHIITTITSKQYNMNTCKVDKCIYTTKETIIYP